MDLTTVTHVLVTKYLIGAGILSGCLLVAAVIMLLERRKLSWARSIMLRAVQLAMLLFTIAVVRLYVHMAIDDYHWTWLSPRIVDLAAVAAAVCVLMYYFSMLVSQLEKTQLAKGSDPTSTRMISRVMRFAAFVTMLLFFGEHFGLSMSGLL